jgi:predicted methyltransferase
MNVVLAHQQAKSLLAARAEGRSLAEVSPDLGLSIAEWHVGPDGFAIGDLTLSLAEAQEIAESERKCFSLGRDGLREIRVLSQLTGWLRSLAPTDGAPTMLVSGIPMHRIKDIEPHADTLSKIRTLQPVRGRVLDTATGLGYTAIELAKTATEVVTIELDPAAIEIARQNPWSDGLFDNPKIKQMIGDASEIVADFPDNHFSAILHDPPTISLGGELYSGAFYKQLSRILKKGGKLFHYVGDPSSGLGARTTQGVIRRLMESGFRKTIRHPEAYGILAVK